MWWRRKIKRTKIEENPLGIISASCECGQTFGVAIGNQLESTQPFTCKCKTITVTKTYREIISHD